MRETTAEEEDMLERQRIREQKLAERGPAKYPFPTVPSPAPPPEKLIRFYDPAQNHNIPQPQSCPLCRGPFYDKIALIPTTKGGYIATYKCRDCKRNFIIQIGLEVEEAKGPLKPPTWSPQTVTPRQVDRSP